MLRLRSEQREARLGSAALFPCKLAGVMAAHCILPRIMRIGAGASKQLPAVLTELNLKRPLIVTDSFFSTRLAPLTDALDEAGFDHHTFDGCVPDPTTDSCAQGLEVRARARSQSLRSPATARAPLRRRSARRRARRSTASWGTAAAPRWTQRRRSRRRRSTRGR